MIAVLGRLLCLMGRHKLRNGRYISWLNGSLYTCQRCSETEVIR